MPRVKHAVAARKRKKRYLDAAEGFRGGRRKLYRTARETLIRAWAFAFTGRKLKKRDYRSLWITRISAATRAHGVSYSQFMAGLRKANIQMNRKMLSEMAIHDPEGFARILEVARQHHVPA